MYRLVSVIIPSYKRSDTVVRAINSVLNQTYKNIEVIVVDDNIQGDEYSIELEKVLGQIKDNRVVLIRQDKHVNGAKARNEGVKASHGDYIAFLDDDDEWWPDKIERQIHILEKNPEYSGIAGGVTLWKDNKEISQLPLKKISSENLLYKVLIREVGLATSSFLCTKSSFENIGGFDETLKRSQDLQLFADFLCQYKIYPIWDFRTTKMHVESSINRLNSHALSKNKSDFFRSIQDVFCTFSKSKQRRIKSAHYYEICFVALKESDYLFALKNFIRGLKSPCSLFDLGKRMLERI